MKFCFLLSDSSAMKNINKIAIKGSSGYAQKDHPWNGRLTVLSFQIYPTSVRTSGVGLASSVGRIGGMTCPLVAIGLIHGCHQTTAVILFEIVVFLSGICVLLFPLETKGRDLADHVAPSKETNTTVWERSSQLLLVAYSPALYSHRTEKDHHKLLFSWCYYLWKLKAVLNQETSSSSV